jgi:hypothetical protein
LAKRLEKEATDEQRIVKAFELCFTREPEEFELQRSLEFLKSETTSPDEPAKVDSLQLLSLCQALLGTAEFRNLD